MPRKTPTSSLAGEIKRRKDLTTKIPVPENVNLGTEREKLLWDQLSGSRAPEYWRESDLLLLGDCVKIIVQREEQEALMASEGAVITQATGNRVINPRTKLIDNLYSRQLSIYRLLSLTVVSKDAIAQNGSGKRMSDLEELKVKEQGKGKKGSLHLLA